MMVQFYILTLVLSNYILVPILSISSSGVGISGDPQTMFYAEVTDEMKVNIN